MQTLSDIEREAMKLPDSSRAYLASRLLNSLPAVLSDDDDGLAEATRRSAEMDQNPGAAMTLEEVRQAVKR
jgi:putative addiction module component (TIGR02574 family)